MDMRNTILNIATFIDPELPTDVERILWRCSTDSIWEGRIATVRWLIEFVGIKADRQTGQAKEAKKDPNLPDVRITNINGGSLLAVGSPGAQALADVWKGCSRAGSHATDDKNHPPVNETQLLNALKIILTHLQQTIYRAANCELAKIVLTPPPKP